MMPGYRAAMADNPRNWTFLSNHAHVLVCLAADPNSRLRDIAAEVGITERRVNGILADLEQAGIVTVFKTGRRNSYKVERRARLRHPLEAHKTVGDLLKGVL
jgi:DNA-binding MarR family transcriptional regulator